MQGQGQASSLPQPHQPHAGTKLDGLQFTLQRLFVIDFRNLCFYQPEKLSPSPIIFPFQVVLEAMKMEYAVAAPCDGTLKHVCVQQGDMVQQGSPLCLVVEE